MFASAYSLASKFTWPVIMSRRLQSGEVQCGLGSFVIVNKDGWIVTAAHVANQKLQFDKDHSAIRNLQRDREEIQNDPDMSSKRKRRKLKHLSRQPDWIVNQSYWWGANGIDIESVTILGPADLMLGKLEPFDSHWVEHYPVFKDPSEIALGTSICKLGFPFHQVAATYDETRDSFELAPNTLPIPRFPIEGIVTREIRMQSEYRPGKVVKFLETSTPGLRGQSGGPIFDRNGTVWALQSHTRHLDLGFSPFVQEGKSKVVENQFLNVGAGVHVEVILDSLTDLGIDFEVSDY